MTNKTNKLPSLIRRDVPLDLVNLFIRGLAMDGWMNGYWGGTLLCLGLGQLIHAWIDNGWMNVMDGWMNGYWDSTFKMSFPSDGIMDRDKFTNL